MATDEVLMKRYQEEKAELHRKFTTLSPIEFLAYMAFQEKEKYLVATIQHFQEGER